MQQSSIFHQKFSFQIGVRTEVNSIQSDVDKAGKLINERLAGSIILYSSKTSN